MHMGVLVIFNILAVCDGLRESDFAAINFKLFFFCRGQVILGVIIRRQQLCCVSYCIHSDDTDLLLVLLLLLLLLLLVLLAGTLSGSSKPEPESEHWSSLSPFLVS